MFGDAVRDLLDPRLRGARIRSMSERYWLHSVSIVVTAQFHNPSILNHHFLVSEGIIPEGWEVSEAVSTPPVSVVRYSNGIHWIVDQSRLVVSESCDGPFREEYEVHRRATAYLMRLPHVPYRNLGLNCTVSMPQEHPEDWLTERFLQHGPWSKRDVTLLPGLLRMAPHFTLEMAGALLHLSCRGGKVRRNNSAEESAVIVECNLHQGGPFDATALRKAIERWSERQKIVIETLHGFLAE